ncbi:hypothetical protein [Lunatimonas lonarensis]|uniref:hypothetical protein n=1 Tax=Lunatimonas lonarensis TaxID=1232681 RepID=UPI001EE2B9F1|nr:hypothetical protein [Lunatimonas lonarensis]
MKDTIKHCKIRKELFLHHLLQIKFQIGQPHQSGSIAEQSQVLAIGDHGIEEIIGFVQVFLY